MLDKNAFGYWKYSSLIVLLIFLLTFSAILLTIINLKSDGAFFINFLQSLITQKSWSSIASIIGSIAAYLYLLFYIEQHQAFIPQEKTKEAKITMEVFMFFRIINYIAPILAIYLIFLVPKDYLYAVVVVGVLAITELGFEPIIKYFNNMLANYRSLEALDPENIIYPLQKSLAQSKNNIKSFWVIVKNRDKNQPLIKTLLSPYKEYIPAFIYGAIRYIIKKGGPQVKNSLILLTFLTILIMLPIGINVVNIFVIAYIELTLFYWFWVSSVVFSGLPESKVNVKLKNGKHYDAVYCIEDNPRGYRLYLNSNNVVFKVFNSDIEEEIPVQKDFTHIMSLKKQMDDKFTYLPIYCRESFDLSIEFIKKELENPKLETWHSKDALKATLKADIDSMPKKEKVSEIIDQFADEFDSITIKLYKNYKAIYEILENKTQGNKVLMLGLYNTLLGCDRIYWPNIYNKIRENDDSSKKYDSLAKQLIDITEFQNYKRLVEEAHEMKDKYKEKLENIIS